MRSFSCPVSSGRYVWIVDDDVRPGRKFLQQLSHIAGVRPYALYTRALCYYLGSLVGRQGCVNTCFFWLSLRCRLLEGVLAKSGFILVFVWFAFLFL